MKKFFDKNTNRNEQTIKRKEKRICVKSKTNLIHLFTLSFSFILGAFKTKWNFDIFL